MKEINEAYSDDRSTVYVAQATVGPIDRRVVDEESISPLGTYSTFEKAQAAAIAYISERNLRVNDEVNIYEVRVNERPSNDEIGKPIWYWYHQYKKGVFWGDAGQQFQK